MHFHRWWLALVGAVLTPWVGPHADAYLPLGWIVLRALRDTPARAFWVIAAGLLVVAYLFWFALLSGASAWVRHRQSGGGGTSV